MAPQVKPQLRASASCLECLGKDPTSTLTQLPAGVHPGKQQMMAGAPGSLLATCEPGWRFWLLTSVCSSPSILAVVETWRSESLNVSSLPFSLIHTN